MKINKSFTIIEILITIMVISIMSIGIMGGYKFFQDELINQSINKKLLLIKNQMENVFNLRIKSFILSSGIWVTNESGTSQLLYEVDKLQPLIDISPTSLFTENDIGTFWNIGSKELKDFANKPFDIVVENKYFTHYTKFPYKNIFIISWGRLNSYPSWTNAEKELFIYKENNETWVFKTFSELNSTSQATLEAWAISKKLPKEIFNKEINFVTISNLDVIKNKVETSINKFNNIVKNIEYWVNAKIKLEDGTGAMPGKNYFMYKKDISLLEDLTNDFIVNTTSTNGSGNLYLDNKMIDIQVDVAETLLDENLTNIFTFVDLTKDDGSNERYISTKDKKIECVFEYFNAATISFKHALPITTLTNNDWMTCSVDVDSSLFIGTKQMMGIISEFDGKEEISGFPIIISNVDESNLSLSNIDANYLNGYEGLDSSIFKNNIPTAEQLSNGSYALKNSPPYSLSMVMIFPWIIESDKNDTSDRNFKYANYGWYKKEIFSVTNGL